MVSTNVEVVALAAQDFTDVGITEFGGTSYKTCALAEETPWQ